MRWFFPLSMSPQMKGLLILRIQVYIALKSSWQISTETQFKAQGTCKWEVKNFCFLESLMSSEIHKWTIFTQSPLALTQLWFLASLMAGESNSGFPYKTIKETLCSTHNSDIHTRQAMSWVAGSISMESTTHPRNADSWKVKSLQTTRLSN